MGKLGKCVPKILEHGEVDSKVVNKLNMLKAIEIMDKSFRPLGAAAKSDAAFTTHEVCMYKCAFTTKLIVVVLSYSESLTPIYTGDL